MRGYCKNMLFQAFLMRPLPPLAELTAHEEQLFAGLGIHIAQSRRQSWRISASITPGIFPSSEALPWTTSS